MKYYVYELWDVIKGLPFYVGKGCGKRTSAHTSKSHLNSNTGNMLKKNVIKKMLSENNSPEVRYIIRTNDELIAYAEETRLILQYGRRDLGTGILTNLTNGGVGSLAPNQEARYRMGSANRGKKLGPDVKMKISESAQNRPEISEETRLKMSLVKKGKRPACVELRRSYAGEGNPQFGKKWDDSKKSKMSNSIKGRKRSYRDDGTWFFVYPGKTYV